MYYKKMNYLWKERRKLLIWATSVKFRYFYEISLIAKYFAISEMYRICLCTNEVVPRVPYPLDCPEVR